MFDPLRWVQALREFGDTRTAVVLALVFGSVATLAILRTWWSLKNELKGKATHDDLKSAIQAMTQTVESNGIFHVNQYKEVVASLNGGLERMDRAWTQNLGLVHERVGKTQESQERVIREVGEVKGIIQALQLHPPKTKRRGKVA